MRGVAARGAEPLIEQWQLDAAKIAGACALRLRAYEVGMPLSSVAYSDAVWIEDNALDAVRGLPMPLWIYSGSGDGYGSGFGSGSGSGYGYGDGYGSGSGSGYGYGYGYGDGYGDGSGSGYGYGEVNHA